MVRVKICGVTNLEDALAAVGFGADALGFVFAPSPRQVTAQKVSEIVAELPPFISKVGVFVNESPDVLLQTMSVCNLDFVQLHGSEEPEYCRAFFPRVIKSFRVKDESVLGLMPRYKVSAYLLDAYDPDREGGTGRTFDWNIARRARDQGRVILSGGLGPENVRQAIGAVRPYAVDASSGVESEPGKKDYDKLHAFLEMAKETGPTSMSP